MDPRFHSPHKLPSTHQLIAPFNQIQPPGIPHFHTNFLETTLLLPEQRTLHSTLYIKPTDKGLLIHHSSHHPNACTIRASSKCTPKDTNISSLTTTTLTQTITATARNPFSQRLFPIHNHYRIQESQFSNTKRMTPSKRKTSAMNGIRSTLPY